MRLVRGAHSEEVTLNGNLNRERELEKKYTGKGYSLCKGPKVRHSRNWQSPAWLQHHDQREIKIRRLDRQVASLSSRV